MSLRWAAGVLLASWLALQAGCASAPAEQAQAQTKAERVEAILTEAAAADDYVAAERCLQSRRYRRIEILDDRHIVFEGRRDEHWLNVLPARCPGLRRGSSVVIERVSGSLCNLDSIAPYDWLGSPWYRRWPWPWGSGPKCALGEFQPVSALQLEAIKAALRPPKG